MKLYVVYDPSEEYFEGPFTDKALADTVLKVFKMTIDEESDIWELETDPYSEFLKAGLKPWKITILLDCGRIQSKEVTLWWPPLEEGVIREDDWVREYFFWAPSQSEALRKISGWKKNNSYEKIMAEV